ncbi:MAG TPA: hypothetical protein VG650_01155 [Mycobacteriales bacterium]|nr:hypothetical protein [Mycobacteriales bacterium]
MSVVTREAARSSASDGWPIEAPLADAHYVDAFTAITPIAGSRTPREWAQQILESASFPMRVFLLVGWRCGLGFRLTRRNAVLGWPVLTESADWVVLRQGSWLFEVALLMRVTDDQLTWSTRVKHSSAVGRGTWCAVGRLHRRFAPRALRRAVNQSGG